MSVCIYVVGAVGVFGGLKRALDPLGVGITNRCEPSLQPSPSYFSETGFLTEMRGDLLGRLAGQ